MWERRRRRRRGCCQVLARCSQPFCGLPEHNPISMTSQKCILLAGATHSKCQVSCCRCNKPVACQLAALPRERRRAFGRQLRSISVRSDISVPKARLLLLRRPIAGLCVERFSVSQTSGWSRARRLCLFSKIREENSLKTLKYYRTRVLLLGAVGSFIRLPIGRRLLRLHT